MANVYWHMTTATYDRYREILDRMAQAAIDANRISFEMGKDALRSLPGFPSSMNPDHDRVIPVIDELSHLVMSFPSAERKTQ